MSFSSKSSKFPGRPPGHQHSSNSGNTQFDLSIVRQYRPLIRKVVEEMRDQLPFDTDIQEVMSVASVVLARASVKYPDDASDSFEAYASGLIREAISREFPTRHNLIPPLPEVSSTETQVPATGQSEETIDLTGCRILVVDDSPLTRRKLRFLLERQKYEIFEARSGEEALWLAPECHPDLILLDVMLDGMNGYDTCRRLKATSGLEEIPVIFLTGKTETEDIVTGFDAGASDYIGKPFKPQEALPRIRTHLNVRLLSDFRRKHIEELHGLNRAKDRLLRIASHDLRNPLSSIRGLSEMLEEDSFGQLNEDQREIVTSIRSAAEGMMGLLTDLLELSTLDGDKMRIKFAEESIGEVAQNVVNLCKVPAGKKSIEVLLDIGMVPERSLFDKNQIRRVIENLVSNAIKFSPFERQVTVRLSRAETDIRIDVLDQGPGIPEEEQSALFKEFSRTSVQPTAGEQSTGLGLSICRRIVEAHGGEISMHNRPEGGACFTFTLPLDPRERLEEENVDSMEFSPQQGTQIG